jgi:hypothetical protein
LGRRIKPIGDWGEIHPTCIVELVALRRSLSILSGLFGIIGLTCPSLVVARE